MPKGALLMTAEERERVHLVRQTVEGHLGQCEAAARVGIGVRQFKRLVHRWKTLGDAGLVSRQRGRPSNHRLSAAMRARISLLLQETQKCLTLYSPLYRATQRRNVVNGR
jgi:transposase